MFLSSDSLNDLFNVIFVGICVLNLSFVLQVLQGYAVTAVAWLYWSRYVSSLLLSWGRYISSLVTRAPSEKPKEDSGAPLKRLMGYMQPYLQRFVVVLFLVVLSSYGKWGNPLDLTTEFFSCSSCCVVCSFMHTVGSVKLKYRIVKFGKTTLNIFSTWKLSTNS